jgi:hypothetical protein
MSERRDVAAAKRFFSKAMNKHGTPRVITLDAYAASHRAIAELKSAGTVAHSVGTRSSKYLNNIVEQDRHRIKQRIRPMLGFKRFETGSVVLSNRVRFSTRPEFAPEPCPPTTELRSSIRLVQLERFSLQSERSGTRFAGNFASSAATSWSIRPFAERRQ